MKNATANLRDLTEYEIRALEAPHNLSDGHPHFAASGAEQEIISRLPELWRLSASRTQATSDMELISALSEFHGQPRMMTRGISPLIAYASSVSIGIVCTYLAHTQRRVSLLEPCFDNLYELLRHHKISPLPLPESIVFQPDQTGLDLKDVATGDTLFIVDPNNPTGTSSLLDNACRFRQIVDYCAETSKMLVVDLSFSAFLSGPGMPGRPDLYEILDTSGIEYILIEDTGKVWPTQDLKCGLISCSPGIYKDVRAIHTGVMLNVSPFTTTLAAEFIRASTREGFNSIPHVIATNRGYLDAVLPENTLRIKTPTVPVSVSWLEIVDGRNAADLQARLAIVGVHVLPGDHFYWSDSRAGREHIRVALSRDPRYFQESINMLVEGL